MQSRNAIARRFLAAFARRFAGRIRSALRLRGQKCKIYYAAQIGSFKAPRGNRYRVRPRCASGLLAGDDSRWKSER